MRTTCPKCHQEYDDVYHSTQCPHEYFQMHTSVFVGGKQGCAHSVEEVEQATKSGVIPNPGCEYMLALKDLLKDIEVGKEVDHAIDAMNAEILANNGFLPDESCHFGDCGQ